MFGDLLYFCFISKTTLLLWAAGEPDYQYGFLRFAYMEQSIPFSNLLRYHIGRKIGVLYIMVVRILLQNDWTTRQLLRFATYAFLAATKQLNEWYFPSVRPSVTPFLLCSHHRIIMKFSRVITNDRSDVHAKGQGQRSKVKVTEVNTQLSRFRTVAPVWIYIWWWNDAQSLMLLRRGALLFFKVIHQISRSQGSKNPQIWPKLAFPDCNSSLNSPMATKWCTKLEVA